MPTTPNRVAVESNGAQYTLQRAMLQLALVDPTCALDHAYMALARAVEASGVSAKSKSLLRALAYLKNCSMIPAPDIIDKVAESVASYREARGIDLALAEVIT